MFRFFFGLLISFLITDWMVSEISNAFPTFASQAQSVYQTVKIPTHDQWPSNNSVNELKAEISHFLAGDIPQLSNSWWDGPHWKTVRDTKRMVARAGARQLQEVTWEDGIKVVRIMGYGPLIDSTVGKIVITRIKQPSVASRYFKRQLNIHSL